MYKLNHPHSPEETTYPLSQPNLSQHPTVSGVSPQQLQKIAAKIDGLRSTSTMYLDLRPLLLEMWSVIVQLQTQLNTQQRK